MAFFMNPAEDYKLGNSGDAPFNNSSSIINKSRFIKYFTRYFFVPKFSN